MKYTRKRSLRGENDFKKDEKDIKVLALWIWVNSRMLFIIETDIQKKNISKMHFLL